MGFYLSVYPQWFLQEDLKAIGFLKAVVICVLETSYDHSLAFPSSSFDHLQYAKMERKTQKDDVMCRDET